MRILETPMGCENEGVDEGRGATRVELDAHCSGPPLPYP
jgi:hypothetical protein